MNKDNKTKEYTYGKGYFITCLISLALFISASFGDWYNLALFVAWVWATTPISIVRFNGAKYE